MITGGKPSISTRVLELSHSECFELGSNGIGFRTAVKAAARGAKVVILDVAEPNGEPLRKFLCPQYSHRLNIIQVVAGITSYVCDVSDRKAVNKVALRVVQEVRGFGERSILASKDAPIQIGAPTILINNAGVMSGKLILDLEEKDVTRWVNCLSPISCDQC